MFVTLNGEGRVVGPVNDRESGRTAPLVVAGLGALLLLAAVVAHARELTVLDSLAGPSIALLLDGLPALGLVYAGYWLSGTDLDPEGRSTVATWCLAGAALFVAVVGATVVVRTFEGRVITEPVFVLLVAAEAGGFAGFLAGYYSARARRDARRAGTASDALAFVNELIRHDLRNDLTVIHGQAELLAADRPSADTEMSPGDPEVIVEKTSEALARIEATRAVAGTLTGDPGLDRVDLAAVTAEMAERVEGAYDVSVRTDLPESAPVTANAGLRSVVDNLLENAAEHNDA